MRPTRTHFSPLARLLHWTMAPLIIAMLFIGVGMVATVSRAHDTLIAIHKPLGIALLLLVVLRVGVRLTRGSPPLPDAMPALQRFAAKASHLVLYVLMAAMPLIGWAMLSAAGYPVTLYGPLHLPPIAPHNVELFALLRALHTWLAFALFATVLLHLAAALLHGLIRHDGVFSSMARGER
ncbi:prokaryotic cytochrome b561 family protein [Paraburkholderia xenovorans LB400]|jgi:cytochrome b561|uniref:Type-b cytochrome n=1 Tax=Paraburkholderia xenovorans (strain LB400) TaxID=266265 RepID=Q13NP0_PARXL|nr:cytochrome b/b6 domain-containing protein [Paraburkholderia xenovorans]ABE34299.1 putative type-b cytochrome [Paraburkholderia xenovorans LB400]AIP35962.1 prokaryotic cytochrome b561 family protein [Paraburkholderia xenovorans LB400]